MSCASGSRRPRTPPASRPRRRAERVSEEADHDDLVELEAELAAASGGLAAGGIGKDEIVSVVPTSALPEVEGGAEPTPGGESPLEGGPEQEASSASRRSVDELFARIRASRAAEEAAAPGGRFRSRRAGVAGSGHDRTARGHRAARY